MLFFKATYLKHTLFPIPTHPHPNVSVFTEKQLIPKCFYEKTSQKINLWKPKLHCQGIFCFEQECY